MSAAGVPLPATLPQKPIVDGLQAHPNSNVVGFDPEIGPPKLRRRATSRTAGLSAAFIYTTAECDIFEAFFEDDLADGSVRMLWTDPRRGDAADWIFDHQTPYTFTPHGSAVGYWVVTWNVTRLP